ncbi:hypothetical protein [Chlamydiifrater volucris]|uniref:hypothetical protein n=1 Tax=Chlamydiifrater volucris TaxID=2681470 RepID=UPI001BCF0ABF|nr:hypothetical protein [Chlamydiifrater volucris]
MSSPIGSRSPSPIPHTSSQEPPLQSPLSGSVSNYLLQTMLLLEDLMAFSLKRKHETILTQSPFLRGLNVLTVKSTSEQIKALAIETSKNCAEIAQSLLNCNISIESSLLADRVLSEKELAQIKASLIGVPAESSETPSEAESTSSGSSTQSKQHVASQEQRHLPLKKQKLRWGSLVPLETPPLQESTEQRNLCSLEALEAILEVVHTNARIGIALVKFSCPRGHTESVCHTCAPLQTMLTNMHSPQREASIWQLEVLLQYTTVKKLAASLHATPSILKKILQGSTLLNHQLAILIDSCNIPDAICLPNTANPALLANFCRTLEEIISSGIQSSFVQAILRIWQSREYLQSSTASIKISTDEGTEKHDFFSLSTKVPYIVRAYLHQTKGKKVTSYRRVAMTQAFADFVAKITIKTVQILQDTPEYQDMLVRTPEGFLANMNLINRIFTLIFLSSVKWQIYIDSCKATAGQLAQRSSLSENETEILYAALRNFSKQYAITLQGSSYF